MANTNPEPWRAHDYTSVPENDEPVEPFPEPEQVPGKADSSGGSSRESSQDSPFLPPQYLENDRDPAHDGVASGHVDRNDDREKSKSSVYLILLTISIGGYGYTPPCLRWHRFLGS